jgi:hypothetical protein
LTTSSKFMIHVAADSVKGYYDTAAGSGLLISLPPQETDLSRIDCTFYHRYRSCIGLPLRKARTYIDAVIMLNKAAANIASCAQSGKDCLSLIRNKITPAPAK